MTTLGHGKDKKGDQFLKDDKQRFCTF